MKIYVAGATGRVASELIADLVAAGNDVIAAARHPENVIIPKSGTGLVEAVPLDLHNSVDTIAGTLGDAQVIYFVAGSRGKDLLQTDAFGAVALMQAAEQKGIERFIMLSSIHSLEPSEWQSEQMAPLRNYITAKFFADHYLIHDTALNYTILQPTNLTEEEGTGSISIGSNSEMTNPIPDVAATLASLLEHPNTAGKVIRMGTGSTPIDEALASIK